MTRYKTVEINCFWGFRRNPKSHLSIRKIPCGNILTVKIVGVCRYYGYLGQSLQYGYCLFVFNNLLK